MQSTNCLQAEEAAGFAFGWIAADERLWIEAHIDECSVCRQQVSELVKSTPSLPSEPREASLLTLPRGARIGRYVIDGMVGAGAMGIVYAAHDPKLDRKVALKMLRTSVSADRSVLEREAQAMARLSHPNVVAIYDIGITHTFPPLFLAMEFIEGITLRVWLEEPRPYRKVLNAFLQAGRGLAAAHASGLLHRDVKPDNILVSHGRVCVTDFGLARAVLHANANTNTAPSGPLALSGTVAGTPRYMAPEQHEGRALDARSDQFSFCAALYEGLYRQFPFEGSSAEELVRAKTNHEIVEPPARAGIPIWIQRAIWRGLSADPEKRFPSMDALLEALSNDPRARRLRWGSAIGAVALLIAAPLAYKHMRTTPMCQGSESKLAGIWGDPPKNAIREALLATKKPFAADTWREVERTLDGYAASWVRARTDACEATHVRGEQSSALLDLRMACLDGRLSEMHAVTDALAHADAETAAKSVSVAQSLTSLASCANTQALLAGVKPPSDATLAAKVDALRDQLARAKALAAAGKYRDGLALATGVAGAAESIDHPPLLAEALFRRGELQFATHDVVGAAASLRRSVTVADGAGDDATRARAASRLVAHASITAEDPQLAEAFNEQSAAAIRRMGGSIELEGFRRVHFADFLRARGKFDEAISELQAALPLLERSVGPDKLETLRARHALGQAYMDRGDFELAESTLRSVLETTEKTLGPRHPRVAVLLSSLGAMFGNQLRMTEAAAYYERARHAADDATGGDNPALAIILANTGNVLIEQGEYEKAIGYLDRALAMRERQGGANHTYTFFPLSSLGEAHRALGHWKQARAYLEKALLVFGRPSTESDRAEVRFSLAQVLQAENTDPHRARALAIEARDALRTLARSPRDRRNLQRVEEWLAAHP